MSTFPPAGLHTPTLLSTSALLPAAPASPEPFPALISRIPIFLAGDHSAEGLVCCAAPPCRCPWLVPAQGRSCRHTGRWRRCCSVPLCSLDAGTNISGQCCVSSTCGGGFWRFPIFAPEKTLPAPQRSRWPGSCRASWSARELRQAVNIPWYI